ncbi:DNA/RNA nuclease SfsA [Marinobacter halophilus]|uniref:Sugar fermentation stimulation protein homolog n=1 Tax=Marinobacter halophilus TaxID=1323740 RepID=A0A2T1KJP9_9GAMM|nr:DNA/RNA nuclease SfsA [Marinobacter halophilus]PSF10407.1 DNA/RNA nuclease SfsA [Marinobacter halophilus]GGC70464.1 sugar fermentation stimulation protein A [Marinobacter halophilus]
MKYSEPLLEGRLIRRYKRFLADVRLPDGQEVTAHCPNTGSMLGCQPDNARVWLSQSDNPKRKLKYTWELVETAPGVVACVNTARPNHQARHAIEAGVVAELTGYTNCRSEVRYGVEKSRIDLLLSGHPERPDAWVEVKNVTLAEGGQGYFPDAVTERGQKHLRELMAQVAQGDRAVLLFVVNHTGIEQVRPADHIDVRYGQLLRQARAAGVEVLAYRAALAGPDGNPGGRLELTEAVPVNLEP